MSIITKIVKAIKDAVTTKELDIKDIPMMKYPEGEKPPNIPPLICHGRGGGSRIKYRR